MPYIPHTSQESEEMLDFIGVKNLDELFADISKDLKAKTLNIPQGLSEFAVCQKLEKMAAKNSDPYISFLGAGFYDHHIPKAVDYLSSRSEFLTAYTPYQAESSQGTLQAIFEFQTAMTRLFDMDCANASVYDCGSAIFEAAMMAIRHTKRNKIVIDEAVNPIWRKMLESYSSKLEIKIITVKQDNGASDINKLKSALNKKDIAALILQNPTFFGTIQDLSSIFSYAKELGTLNILAVSPVIQSVIKSPGEMGADIAVAEGQAIGMPLSFGGPYLGIMTCKKELVRNLPGRIVGRTEDVDGKTAYVLTLQAREQHIRRAKATSNICSNQALCALRSVIHLSLLGAEGLTRVAELSMDRMHYLSDKLCAIKGIEAINKQAYGYELAFKLPIKAKKFIQKLSKDNFIAGFPIGDYYKKMDDVILIACTEKLSYEEIDNFVDKVSVLLK